MILHNYLFNSVQRDMIIKIKIINNNNNPFTLLTASHTLARFQTSAAGEIQRFHLNHRHERDGAYDGT